ncbi:DsrE family protein [Caproicibacterium sp. BJN0003]|uniref:DsrE family protein n=1 Tax=Caproicibacterium sp. BJN0003 TaxID=2994078 RepID=UPI0022508DA9|nr:DsrE family protein [Caproicibacterium sp. BJN0003]UZT81288.1 DsrE family protein [Caproicibacterium sp. BJN0003]
MDHVIFHIDEFQKWKLLLNNVKNLLLSYDNESSNISVEVLANSEAVKGYIDISDSVDKNSLEVLSQKGVTFAACNNALLAMDLSKEEIFSFVKIVPVGVRELINKQQEGYAYIKP